MNIHILWDLLGLRQYKGTICAYLKGQIIDFFPFKKSKRKY